MTSDVERPMVVHVLDRLSIGGMETIALNVIEATRHMYAHHVICLYERGARATRAEAMNVSVESIDKHAGKDVLAYFRLWWRLRRIRPAIVHTYNVGALDVCFWARLAGVRHVVHAEHGRDVSDPEGKNPKYRRLRRWLAPLIGFFVPVSADLAYWLERDVGVAPDKIRVIHNGIDTSRFTPEPLDQPSSVEPDSVARDTVVIGSIGRLDGVKAFDLLIDAFAGLRRTLPDTPLQLVIVGEGPERDALAAQIDSLDLNDTVHLAGARDDIDAFLRTLDVYACSSITEGIALTILEAMAVGLPVVATRVGGNPELVRPGETGMLVRPNDPEALAEALAFYAGNRGAGRAAGRAGRDYARAEFDVHVMIGRYLKLYDRLLDREAPEHATQQD